MQLPLSLDKAVPLHLLWGIINKGYDPVYGARPLRRFLQQSVETLAAKIILGGRVHEGEKILIDVRDGELVGETG